MARVVPILDSHIAFDPKLVPAVRAAPDQAAELLQLEVLPDHIDLTVWCYLIETGDAVGLVDTGSGTLFGDPEERLEAVLRTHGVEPEDVTRIWLTHLHGDHCGGLIDAEGNAIFPNARVAAPKIEADHWLSGTHDGMSGEIARDARAALAPYADRLDRVSPGQQVEGPEALAAYGHTPGQLAWHVPDLNVIAAGDIFHVPALQLRHLDWSTDWDTDPDEAAQTRKRLMDLARDTGHSLLTGHGGAISPTGFPQTL